MKNLLSFLLPAAILLSGCTQEELRNSQPDFQDGRTFTASFEQDRTRTYVEDGNLLRWTAGDQISLFDGNTLNRQYKFDGETGDNSGTFSIVSKPFGTGNALSANYSVYPYSSDVKITETGVITATLPAEQSYAYDSFGLSANTMVAVTKDIDDTFLKFKNVCGYLKIRLYGDDITVKSISLTGNDNEGLAGKASVATAYGDEPKVVMSDEATSSITLNCGEGVKIGSTAETATAFWIAVPPTTFERGFEITVTDINGNTLTKSTSNEITVERNVIKPMKAIKVNLDALDLPDGSAFNTIVTAYIPDAEAITKVKFISDSQNTDGILFHTDGDGTRGYLVTNGDCLEIHTSANVFMAHQDCSNMFGGYTDANWSITPFYFIESIDFGANFNTSRTVDMSSMFQECISLETLDLRSFDTSNVIDMSCMFRWSEALSDLDISEFNTAKVTAMDEMFYGCTALASVDVSGFDTSEVSDFSSMFSMCSALSSVDVSGFNTSGVTDMSHMFSECSSLKSLDVSGFDTSNVTDMSYMFKGCTGLEYLEVSGFDTSEVIRMSCLFDGCYSLKSLDVSDFNTLKVTGMGAMFRDCSLLKSLDVKGFDTSNVRDMGGMFSGCASLESLDLSHFTFDLYPSVADMLKMTGSEAAVSPILVKVSKDGCIYLTQVTNNCNIDSMYAKFVNEDGSDCSYEQDNRIYNYQTMAVKPELDEYNVYLIQSAGNLKWFMENCEGEYSRAHYRLTTDIISYNIYWEPVWFGGVFDGGNHSIANLKYYGYENLAYGFFDNLYGTVKNLILINPKSSQSGDNDAYGMNSGLLAATSSGSIINCAVIGGSLSISSTSKAWATGGGMVGCLQSGAVMKGCYVSGVKIEGMHKRNGTYIGGLVAQVNSDGSTITSCYTKDITLKGNDGCSIGTLIGHTKSSEITINSCYYDNSGTAIGGSYSSDNIVTDALEALTDDNFAAAIARMNIYLTDCDYLFDEDGSFVRNDNQ